MIRSCQPSVCRRVRALPTDATTTFDSRCVRSRRSPFRSPVNDLLASSLVKYPATRTVSRWSWAVTNKSAPSSREFWQRFVHDRRGVTAVFVALAATVLIGFVGLGAETGLWYALKRQDQSAADAAAISGAYEIAQFQGTSDICALAKRDAASNGFPFQSYTCPSTSPGCTNPSSGQMCANNPPAGSSNTNAVEVVLNRQENTLFAN